MTIWRRLLLMEFFCHGNLRMPFYTGIAFVVAPRQAPRFDGRLVGGGGPPHGGAPRAGAPPPPPPKNHH